MVDKCVNCTCGEVRPYSFSAFNLIDAALFHPRLPDDPLVFIQVALTDQVSSNVQEILGERPSAVDENRGSCAIFYSISATERGNCRRCKRTSSLNR